jgi:hypothetical protein
MRVRIAASARPIVIDGRTIDFSPSSRPETGNHGFLMAKAMISSGPNQKLGIETPMSAKKRATLSIQEFR